MSNKEVVQAMKLSEAYSILEKFYMIGKDELYNAIYLVYSDNNKTVEELDTCTDKLTELVVGSMAHILKDVKNLVK